MTAELQSKVDAARERYARNPSENNSDSLINAERDLGNAKRDGECLIMGCVSADYIKRVKELVFMEPKIYELLNSIPEHADYAVTAGDLDPEDIPQERIDAVLDLLRNATTNEEQFLAAKLLTSWGVHEGLIALEGSMEEPEGIEGTYSHYLYGYDDTYRQILLAVTRYFANMADRGGVEAARVQIYSPLSKIIALASSKPFEIAKVFDF
ncbi:hypothetical protein, partial [Pseudomonas amygdali]|uniref:hypothetical protein n=1 Tax=Pseudomonas amygdali TaxID=47877 RepID=UPI001F1D8910